MFHASVPCSERGEQRETGERAMEPDEDRAIQEFCSITASSRERARFFLESCGWQVLTAVQNYYEADAGDGGDGGEEGGEGRIGSRRDPQSLDHAPDSAPSPSLPRSSRAPPAQGVGRFESAPKPPSRDKKAAAAGGSSGRSGGIRTLSDFNRRSDSDSDDDTQEYYTGGEKRYADALSLSLRLFCPWDWV
jgi:UBX domain-containing protein 1